MKKILLSLSFGLFIMASVSAQQAKITKHWTAGQDLSTTWFNTGITATADVTACTGKDSVYAEYNITEEAEDNLLNRNWWYDFGFTMTAEEWEAMNQTLHLSFWANPLDGINGGDSIELLFAIKSTFNDIEVERGWPTHWVTLPANTWTWVSIDMTSKSFDGPSTVMDMTGATTFKVAPQPIAGKYDLTKGAYKMAYQDITLSAGALAVPASNPCTAAGTNTAINTKNESSNLFFPNPAKGSINLNKVTSGQIIDLSGKVVANFNNTNKVSLVNIASGLYFVKAGNQVEKLVIE